MFKSFLKNDKPAQKWVECYPIGNGNIGVMDNQNPSDELIQLNDDTFWSGSGKRKHNEKGATAIAKIRELTLSGQKAEAENLIHDNILGNWTENYLPAGDLHLTTNIPSFLDYNRKLDMNNATLTSEFTVQGKKVKATSAVSYPDKVFIKQIISELPLSSKLFYTFPSELRGNSMANGNTLAISLTAPSHSEPTYHYSNNPITYNENKGLELTALVKVFTNGKITANGGELSIENYTELSLVYTSKTSYNFDGDRSEYCNNILIKAETMGFQKLLENHIADYRKLYDRLDFSVNGITSSPENTELCLMKFKRHPDNALIITLFNFGRYLTIAASRQGTQATNLQGIWNKLVRPPWSSNYTTNINTEMNYFGTDLVNLSDCVDPLFNLIKKCYENGKVTARQSFGMNGWVLAHNSDLWGHSSPVGGATDDSSSCTFGLFIGGSGWILHHLFEHYLFTKDAKMLNELLPYLAGACDFYLDYLSPDKNGKLVPNPSASPENRYIEKSRTYAISTASTMELSIIRTTFTNYLKAAAELGVSVNNSEKILQTIDNMKGYVIDKKGAINEWDESYRQTDIKHRHVSHLYGLHPQYEITPEKTPELAEAAKKTLKIRGMGGTGWSLAWKINMYARLKDGEKAYKLIRNQLRYIPASDKTVMKGGGSYSSLLCAHPPFQIDGNFGAMSGIGEMLIQSHGENIELLPAMPSAWASGSVRGLKARGNYTVDINWTNGKVKTFTIYSEKICKVKVKVNNAATEVETVLKKV